MRDQAEKLRKMIENLKVDDTDKSVKDSTVPTATIKRNARVITITSGKGGVGKTNITVNLAVALSELGLRVVILDADFGLANIDVLFGIMSQNSLVDLIRNNKSITEVLTDGPLNIKFISGGSGVEELINLEKEQLDEFVKNICLLDEICDIILIDTGAGVSESVMKFVMASDEIILIATPEPTSITDAYALLKMVSNRDKNKTIRVLINRAEDEKEAMEVSSRLYSVANKFLRLQIQNLGYVLKDDCVIKAVKQQQPFLLSFPKSLASRHIQEMAQKLLISEAYIYNSNESGIKRFVNKLANIFQ